MDFTPPQTLPCFDDDLIDSGAAPSSSSSSAYVGRSNGSGKNNMSVMLYQPQSSSGQKHDEKTNDDVDDYDNERRCSPCGYESLMVHFGSEFSGNHDSFGGENDAHDGDKVTDVAEPDSTLEFYSS